MVNLKCKKLFMRGKDFCCFKTRKIITECDKDCKDMVMSQAWKDLLYEENDTEDLDAEEFTLW